MHRDAQLRAGAKVSFAFSGMESASLTGGGREHAWQAV